MDERKSTIRELEEKKRLDTESRNRLLRELGQSIIQRAGEHGSLPADAGGILAEYRALLKDIIDSGEAIKHLEADSRKMKDLEDNITAKESESSRLAKDFVEACINLGKALLAARFSSDLYRQQEETLLAKIEEQEQKIKELEERDGGVFAWIGKNAQIAVSRALLLKHRSALQKVYRGAGELFFTARPDEALEGEVADAAFAAEEIKEIITALEEALVVLKSERRVLADTFGVEGSPAKRIHALQKKIALTEDEFSVLYLKLGCLAAKDEGKQMLAETLTDEDTAILERAAFTLRTMEENDLKVRRLKAEINIDSEKAEIEKIKKAISNQRHKIAVANGEIAELENQINEAEEHIAELKAFLKENE